MQSEILITYLILVSVVLLMSYIRVKNLERQQKLFFEEFGYGPLVKALLVERGLTEQEASSVVKDQRKIIMMGMLYGVTAETVAVCAFSKFKGNSRIEMR